MESVDAGTALCVPGNHDMKLMRKLRGQGRPDHARTGGIAGATRAVRTGYAASARRSAEFIDDLVSHYVLDDGKLVVAHAGMKESMQGRGSGKVREFALYGETTGETDEFGLPVRYNWAAEYRGPAMVVYGHTPVPEPEWLNRTINIDTGCVFGGKLTALRYPERELVSVPARQTYAEPRQTVSAAEESKAPDLVRPAATRRFARHGRCTGQADRHHPPAPQHHDPRGECHRRAGSDEPVCRKSQVADLSAAHDVAAARRARSPDCWSIRRKRSPTIGTQGVPRVVCEQKHMGSRAVVIVCRDEEAARRRFGVTGEGDRHLLHPHRPTVLR